MPDSSRDFVLGEYLLVAVDAEGFVLPKEWSAFEQFPWSEYSEILASLDGRDMLRLEVSEVETPFTLNVHTGYDEEYFFRDIPLVNVMTERGPEDSMASGICICVFIRARQDFAQATRNILAALPHLERDLERVRALADARWEKRKAEQKAKRGRRNPA